MWPAAGVLAGVAIALAVAGAGIVGSSAPVPPPAADAAGPLDATVLTGTTDDGTDLDAAQAAGERTAPLAKADPKDLLTASPGPHSEAGGLVAGFPSDLIPLPDDAVILVTWAEPVGDADVQEVSLNLHTALTTTQVFEMYRAALTKAGFTEADAVDSSLDATASFSRGGGDELVVLGVLDDGTSRTVTIGGRVRDGG